MSKKRRPEKTQKATPQARVPLSTKDLLKLFPGLFLRALLVIMPLTIIMTLLGANGLTLFNDFWVQMGCYIAAYAVFNNFIFGPVKRYRAQLGAATPTTAAKPKK